MGPESKVSAKNENYRVLKKIFYPERRKTFIKIFCHLRRWLLDMDIKPLPLAFTFFFFFLTACNGAQLRQASQGGFLSGDTGCGFSRVMLKRGSRYIYRDRPAVLKVEKELMSYARKANGLLEKQFGFEPFVIENLESDYVGENNGVSEVYVQTRKDLWTDRKEIVDKGADGNYSAYCTVNNFDRHTGAIKETDIVFSPEYYVDPRSKIKKAERILDDKEEESERAEDYIRDRNRKVREAFEEEERQINQIQDPELRDTLLERLEDKRQQWERTIRTAYKNKKEFDQYWEDYEDNWEDYEDDIKGLTLITMLHEMGHALGYGHTPGDPENLMNPTTAGDILTGRQINAVLCAFHNFGGLTVRY